MTTPNAPSPAWTPPSAPTNWGHPTPPSHCGPLTSTVLVNAYLADLSASAAKPTEYRVIDSLTAYTNGTQRISLLNTLGPDHPDHSSYAAASTLAGVITKLMLLSTKHTS